MSIAPRTASRTAESLMPSASSLRVKPGLTTVTRRSRLSWRSPSDSARTANLVAL